MVMKWAGALWRRPMLNALSCTSLATLAALLPAATMTATEDAARRAATGDAESRRVVLGEPPVRVASLVPANAKLGLPRFPRPQQDHHASRPGQAPHATGSTAIMAAGLVGGSRGGSAAFAARNTEPNEAAAEVTADHPHTALGREDPLALLRLAKRRYDETVQDYTVRFVRRSADEDGRLGEPEVMACKFRQQPFNVFMRWTENADRIDRALYAPAQLGPDIFVHPTGLAGLFVSAARVSLDGEHAESARRIQEFGFGHALACLVETGEQAEAGGELNMSFEGERVGDEAATLRIDWRAPDGPGYDFGRVMIELDRESLLPTAISLWHLDGRPAARYEYHDVQLNIGLGDSDFTREACGL